MLIDNREPKYRRMLIVIGLPQGGQALLDCIHNISIRPHNTGAAQRFFKVSLEKLSLLLSITHFCFHFGINCR
jgi:hypothetical protein